MKKLLLTICVSLLIGAAFAQPITDTAAFIAKNGSSDYVMLDGKVLYQSFGATFTPTFVNQKVILDDNAHKPFMLLSLPTNLIHTPAFGEYKVMSGKKLAVKRNSQIAKVDLKPNYITIDDGGTVQVFEFNGLHWFFADNISIINKDTQEAHKLSFKIGMFIEKK
jgi:hypothetical protein